MSTAVAHADLVVLCLDEAGRADGDNGVALWTQPECAGGAVRIDTDTDTVTVQLGSLPAQIARVLVVAQADGVADLAACGSLTGRVALDGNPAAELSIPSPPAMPTVQVGALYRHGGGWKVRCMGDGYQDGLAKLLTVHGVDVSDDAPAAESAPAPGAPAPPPAASPAAGGIRMTKGEDQLPVDMRKKLSLRKEAVAKVMLTKGIGDVTARVILVLDASGSMAALYRGTTMTNSVERVVAVAAQLDDDGELEAWRFATKSAQLPMLQLGDLPRWLEHCIVLDKLGPSLGGGGEGGGLFGRRKKSGAGDDAAAGGYPKLEKVGFGNAEQHVIADVRRFVSANPTPDPTLVLFFSDGGVYNDKEIETELIGAQREPIFWQFIGLGSAGGYGVLERFDTLPGREIDNVGFFAIDDIDGLPDSDLYDRILGEFPQWLRAVKSAGVV